MGLKVRTVRAKHGEDRFSGAELPVIIQFLLLLSLSEVNSILKFWKPHLSLPKTGVDLRTMPVEMTSRFTVREGIFLFIGGMFILISFLFLARILATGLAHIAPWELLPLLHLTAGVVLVIHAARQGIWRRSVRLSRSAVWIRQARFPLSAREHERPLADYRGIVVNPISRLMQKKNKQVPGFQVVLEHSDPSSSVSLMESADELRALRYQKQAALALAVPLIEADDRVRPAAAVARPLGERIGQGDMAFDATPEPPPEGCFSRRDDKGFIILTTQAPYAAGPGVLLRRIFGTGKRSRDSRRAIRFQRGLQIAGLVLFSVLMLGNEVFFGAVRDYGPLLLLFAAAAAFVVFAYLRWKTRDHRDFLRVAPDEISLGTATPNEEKVTARMAIDDLEAVQLGSESDRSPGLYLLGSRQILIFGATLSPEALAWAQRAVLVHLDTGKHER